MVWIEQITLRSTNESLLELDLEELLKKIRTNEGAKPTQVKICKHDNMDTDISIFLFWDDQFSKPVASVYQYLARNLNEYGLINHSMWIEMMEATVD